MPILKIPFWGRRYGIDKQHTKKISPLALPGAEIFRGGTMYLPRATHNNHYPGTGRVNKFLGEKCRDIRSNKVSHWKKSEMRYREASLLKVPEYLLN